MHYSLHISSIQA